MGIGGGATMTLHQISPVIPISELGVVHFIGIGGVSMSGIAQLLAERGVTVTGCDREESTAVSKLRSVGIDVAIGHDRSHLCGVDSVVYNSAVTPANQDELDAIATLGINKLHRSAALASLIADRHVIAVTGSHGKTTTSAMVQAALESLDPGYMVGSIIASTQTGAHAGRSDVFIVEADESDGSFLQYDAKTVVITNIEADHLDNWGTSENYREGFRRMVMRDCVEQVIVCADDEGAYSLGKELRALGKRVITYGISADADAVLSDVSDQGMGSRAVISYRDSEGMLALGVPGTYNLRNAAAAYIVARELGIDDSTARHSLGLFKGTARRFQLVGESSGIRVIDDYAHHPTEVAAALTAARSAAGAGRVVAIFQPHLFSRTRDFAEDFGQALARADVVVVCDIYPAREEPIAGVTGELVAKAVKRFGVETYWVQSLDDVSAEVAKILRSSDVVMTIGAGSITTVGAKILELIDGDQ
ncbi:MAG: UDP-N-acetylmuramate--L-alanine ligase [Propionibacteriaceae bacterium]